MVADNRAYMAAGTAGLQIIDVGDPAVPDLVGSYDTYDIARRLDVVGATVDNCNPQLRTPNLNPGAESAQGHLSC
jgi:hypothetical protein